MLKKIAVLLVSALVTAQVSAHGIWFAERSTQLAFLYGVGADDLDAVKRLPKVASMTGYDEDWDKVDAQLTVSGPLVLVTSEDYPVAVSAVLNNGIWSTTGEGHWIGKGRDEVPNAILSEETIKYAVHIRGTLRAVPALATQTLQIVPFGNVFPQMIGEPMTYQVLYQGKPVAGALVKADFINDPDAVPVTTGADGKVTFALRNQGLNVLVATFDGPSDKPQAIDKIEHLATFSFVLPHAPE